MEHVIFFIRLALIMTLSTFFIFLFMCFTRLLMQKILSNKLIHNAIKPMFEPSADSTALEKSYWSMMSIVITICITLSIAFLINDIFEVILELIESI